MKCIAQDWAPVAALEAMPAGEYELLRGEKIGMRTEWDGWLIQKKKECIDRVVLVEESLIEVEQKDGVVSHTLHVIPKLGEARSSFEMESSSVLSV